MNTATGTISFKNIQDKYIKKKDVYLEEKGDSIKPFKPTKKMPANPIKLVEKQHEENKAQSRSSEKLEILAQKINKPLMKLTTMPIFKLFPITVTIDLKKITIDNVNFVKSHSLQTIPYEGIRDVVVETGLASATLRFTLSSQTSHPIILPHFKKREALKAKQIIIGIMNCMKSQINPDDLDPERDLEKIMTLGKAASF